MRTAVLTRTETGDQGTLGNIKSDSGKSWVCIELPWRFNIPDKSCVLPGVYPVAWTFSPRHGCFLPQLQNVPGRTACEIHGANLAGDVDKGYLSQLLGCIAPGLDVQIFPAGTINGQSQEQKGVAASQTALKDLIADLGHDTWELTIEWAAGLP